MTKVLIVDDEPLICVGLRSILRWEDFDIEIAGTARNGQQAAVMIESLRPDIVISDIKMPLKTGLELAEECGRKYGRVPLFIILTSFEEFEFVRRALSYQAVDYLVKLELTPEILAASIKKALGILEQFRITTPQTKSQMQGLREKFLLGLINGFYKNREEFECAQKELGFSFSGPVLAALTAEIETPEHRQPGDEGLHALYASTAQMVWEKLEKIFTCYVVITDARRFAVIFSLPDADPVSRRNLLEGELRKTIEIVHGYFNVHVRMALGFPVEDPFTLDESYLAARQVFRETSREDPLRFFEQSGGGGESRMSYKRQVVANAQDYIRRNLDKRLSLHEVAAVFNLSPNYLSQLFAKYSGEGFVEFITAERIRTAKKMLAEGAGPIYEIAEKLGYESAFYFSKVFKKAEGVSPREFIRRLEKGEAF
jgi:two-component system response regulator YesN